MANFRADLWVWVLAVGSHLIIWITGSVLAAVIVLIDKLTDWSVPKWLYAALFVFALVVASFEAWRDEHRRATHDSAATIELATLRDDFYSRMNDWWTVCEDEEKWRVARDAAEAARSKIYKKLAAISVVYADEFNTQRADERLPEAIMLKSSGCLHPGVISVYWHRLDRLGRIIEKLEQKLAS